MIYIIFNPKFGVGFFSIAINNKNNNEKTKIERYEWLRFLFLFSKPFVSTENSIDFINE